jgi:hypothetical protein
MLMASIVLFARAHDVLLWHALSAGLTIMCGVAQVKGYTDYPFLKDVAPEKYRELATL